MATVVRYTIALCFLLLPLFLVGCSELGPADPQDYSHPPDLVALTGLDEFCDYPSWSPDGAEVAVACGPSYADTLFRISVSSPEDRVALWHRETVEWIDNLAWSPQGDWIVFERVGSPSVAGLYVIRPDGTGLTWLGEGTEPAWSPDGKWIAFIQDGVRIVHADGSGAAQLSAHAFFSRSYRPSLSWSPDGSKISFISDRDDRYYREIYAVNVAGSDEINLTRNPGDDTSIAWSPDGRKIAFLSSRDKYAASNVYVMNTDGSNQVPVTQNRLGKLNLAWSPDASRISYIAGVDILVANADGSKQKRVVNLPGCTINSYAWSPDGQSIAFSCCQRYCFSIAEPELARQIYVVRVEP